MAEEVRSARGPAEVLRASVCWQSKMGRAGRICGRWSTSGVHDAAEETGNEMMKSTTTILAAVLICGMEIGEAEE